jgi:hypothetical protein
LRVSACGHAHHQECRCQSRPSLDVFHARL